MIELRKAMAADCRAIWEVNNHPSARAVSGNAAPIPYEDHLRWFAERLIDPNSEIWIVEFSGQMVGVVRFEPRASGPDEISMALAPSARGKGIGRTALRRACETRNRPVRARIHPKNKASIRCFESAGFSPLGDPGEQTASFRHYQWSTK